MTLIDCRTSEKTEERMAAADQRTAQPLLMDKCINCLVFKWGQPEPSTLKKCKQCKVLQYCSESCQKEHWKLVHKKQCKQITSSRDEGGDDFSVFSPISKFLDEPKDALVMMTKMILEKMEYNSQPAFTRVSSQLTRFEADMTEWMALTWAHKKIYPGKINGSYCDPSSIIEFIGQNQIDDKELASQDLWLTLHLVVGRLPWSLFGGIWDILKDPRGAVPPELWTGLQHEVGVFPSRVLDLIAALYGSQLPSFQELLKIFCGGTLRQTCSFCKKRATVAAVTGEVAGCYAGSPTVSILPFLPPMFSCGADTCLGEILEKEFASKQFMFGLAATHARLESSRCDYCFMVSEKIHR